MWIKVRGSRRPIKIETSGLSDVDSLLQRVKEKVPQKLSRVDPDDMLLYRSQSDAEAGQGALRPGLQVINLEGGGTDDDPLYVDLEAKELEDRAQKATELAAEAKGAPGTVPLTAKLF